MRGTESKLEDFAPMDHPLRAAGQRSAGAAQCAVRHHLRRFRARLHRSRETHARLAAASVLLGALGADAVRTDEVQPAVPLVRGDKGISRLHLNTTERAKREAREARIYWPFTGAHHE